MEKGDLMTEEEILTEEILKLLISKTPVVYIVLDKKFKIHFANQYFTDYRQFSKDFAIGNICYVMANAGKKCNPCAVADAIRTGKPQQLFRKDILPSGTVLYIDNYAIPLYNEKNKKFDYILEVLINRNEAIFRRQQRDSDYIEIIHVLTELLTTKDKYTAQHSKTVGRLSVRMAKAMKMSEKDLFDIDIAASLHDIGKVFVPNEIINKQGKLTPEEFYVIKQHPVKSRELLEDISGFQKVKEYVQFHHERYDRKGYPFGLGGDEIPLGARIIAVADAYDAMTTTRSYRQALSHEAAVDIIKKNAGTQFDPKIVSVFLTSINQSDQIPAGFEERREKRFEGVIRKLSVHDKIAKLRKKPAVVPEKKFIKAIFEKTPIGYLVVNEKFEMCAVNKSYQTLIDSYGNSVLGRKCYDYTSDKKKCRTCVVEKAMTSGELEMERIRKETCNGVRYFDVFAFPLPVKSNMKHIAQVLVDRTEATELRLQHEKDLSTLIRILSALLTEVVEEKANRNSLPTIAVDIARILHLSENRTEDLEIAANLCNIGKISMGSDGKNISEEKMYREHAEKSWGILEKLSGFTKIKDVILHHHEHYDGTGFPDGLKGRGIPLESRIIAIAEEVYYSSGILNRKAVEKLYPMAGIKYDPAILDELSGKLSHEHFSFENEEICLNTK